MEKSNLNRPEYLKTAAGTHEGTQGGGSRGDEDGQRDMEQERIFTANRENIKYRFISGLRIRFILVRIYPGPT